jgi:hypothetical protein
MGCSSSVPRPVRDEIDQYEAIAGVIRAQRAETASTPTAKAFYTALENGYRSLAIYREGLD